MTESMREHHKAHHLHESTEVAAVSSPEIISLKEEILAELKENKKEARSSLSWGGILVTAALGFLAIFSIVQAVQTTLILNKIKSNNFGVSGAAAAGAQNLQNLPNMVGGC